MTGSVGSVVGAVGSVTGLTASDVGVIKAVTDKLDDTLEDDAGTYRFTTNALEQAPSGGGSLTVQDIVDGVLDEMIASHQDAGSVGEAISDAGAAGNPWNAVVEGSLTGGDLLRAAAAVNAGNLTAVRNANGSITFTYRDVSNASDIVAGTADRNGNRTVVVTP